MRSPERSPPVTSWREGTLRRTSSTSANSAPATVKRHATSVAGGTAATLSRIAAKRPPPRTGAATVAATPRRGRHRRHAVTDRDERPAPEERGGDHRGDRAPLGRAGAHHTCFIRAGAAGRGG